MKKRQIRKLITKLNAEIDANYREYDEIGEEITKFESKLSALENKCLRFEIELDDRYKKIEAIEEDQDELSEAIEDWRCKLGDDY